MRAAGVRDLALLLLAAVAILAPGISSLPPVDRDEPRYEVATTQMLQSGNFVDIRYQAEPRYLQPAGVYWLQAIPTALFSAPQHRRIWTYRLPSLLGALFAALVTAWSASRLFGRRVGLSAGVLLASCLSLGFEARIGKTDAALLAAVVVTQFALMRAYLAPTPRWASAAFWAGLGVGVLLKGPIILLVTGLTVAGLALWDRRAAWLGRLRPLWGAPLALLIALPWYVAIGLVSSGEFYRIAVGRSLVGKVAVGQQAHGAPFGYHLLAFPLTFWPASLLAVAAAPFVWRERRDPAVRFLVAWSVPAWIAFELVKTKLPHYVLPLFPAIACLAALALFSPRPAARPWLRALGLAFAALWAVLSAAVSALPAWALWSYERRLDPASVALGVLSLACAALLAWSLHRLRPAWVVGAAAAAGAFAAANVYAVAAPRLQTFWLSPRIVAASAAVRPCPEPLLVSTPYHEPSLVFLNGPARTWLADTPEAAADRFAQTRRCALALVGDAQLAAFRARAARDGLQPVSVATLQGRDYADGRTLLLTLFRAAAAPAAGTAGPTRPGPGP